MKLILVVAGISIVANLFGLLAGVIVFCILCMMP